MKIAIFGWEHLAEATAICCKRVGFEPVTPGFFEYEENEKLGLLWYCVDTPVNENDQSDLRDVLGMLRVLLDMIRPAVPVLISSQLPVGTISKLQMEFPTHHLAYQPENIRKAHAVEDFQFQNRMIVGTIWAEDIPLITEVLSHFTPGKIHFMSPESAEMTKHALNAWLAMNICFANEIRDICVKVGADVADVFDGFRSDRRVGGAPLTPGDPITGGTLLRDVRVIEEFQDFDGIITAIHHSNDYHS
jgi:UDPglucose 6-dehydrogenase